jgi:hypothetical protein
MKLAAFALCQLGKRRFARLLTMGRFLRDCVHIASPAAAIQLGEGAVEIPREGEAAVFVVLEALEFLDEVELELQAEP